MDTKRLCIKGSRVVNQEECPTKLFQSGSKRLKNTMFVVKTFQWFLFLYTNTVGTWNRTIWNLDFLIIQFQMVRFSYGHSKSGCSCPDFNWFSKKKYQPFVRILNGSVSGFQIPYKIWTIATQPLFDHSKSQLVWIPFEIPTSLNFRSPLYNRINGQMKVISTPFFTLPVWKDTSLNPS